MSKTRRRTRKASRSSPRRSAQRLTIQSILRDPTIGEGKSKSIYVPPRTDDVAVLLAFFNPVNFKRPLKNILYVMHTLAEQDIPFYVIECVFPKRRSQIPGARVVHSATPMFYKEQLFNLLEKDVPEKYKKLVFMDGDIIFEAPDWVDQVSIALEEFNIIQPYESACWLYPDNISVKAKKKSLAWAIANEVDFSSLVAYHPGFAWAMRRDFFRTIGGFFDKKFLGAGDIAIGAAIVPGISKKALTTFTGQETVAGPYLEFYERVKAAKPRVGYLPFEAYHLFHGLRQNRGYTTRYRNLKGMLNGDFSSFTTINKDGLYEFTDPELIEYAKEYFAARDEDVSITAAMEPDVGGPELTAAEDPNVQKN